MVGSDTRRISFEIGSNKSELLMDTRKNNPLRRISGLMWYPNKNTVVQQDAVQPPIW